MPNNYEAIVALREARKKKEGDKPSGDAKEQPGIEERLAAVEKRLDELENTENGEK